MQNWRPRARSVEGRLGEVVLDLNAIRGNSSTIYRSQMAWHSKNPRFKGSATGVDEHARNQLCQDPRLMQFAAARQVEQRIVRRAAPQKERQSRRQLEIGNAVRGTRRRGGRVGLNAERKSGLTSTRSNAARMPSSKLPAARPRL
jgi:hypothetical protein